VSALTRLVSFASMVSTSAVNASERRPPILDSSRYAMRRVKILSPLNVDLTRPIAPLGYLRTGHEAHRFDLARIGSGIDLAFTHGMELRMAGQKRFLVEGL
jgi:hypothetical protein